MTEQKKQNRLSDYEVTVMWENITRKIKKTRKRVLLKKIIYSTTTVAASILALMVVRLLWFQPVTPVANDSIIMFADNHGDLSITKGEVQLILSEEKTVYIQESEAVISYDSTNIHTGVERLSKDEVGSYNQLIVPFGKNTLLTLHDGTKIWVNAGTRLVYPTEFETGKREVYVSGEIFLDVAADEQRPFIVRTDELQIKVVGTQFNVQAYKSDEHSRIALASGSVKISYGNAEDVTLNPNQLFERDKNGFSSVEDTDIEQYTSWIYKLYAYNSERLGVILKRLERYYGNEIIVESYVSEFRCSGKLDLKENLEDVLSNICKTAPIVYENDGEKYIINYNP